MIHDRFVGVGCIIDGVVFRLGTGGHSRDIPLPVKDWTSHNRGVHVVTFYWFSNGC